MWLWKYLDTKLLSVLTVTWNIKLLKKNINLIWNIQQSSFHISLDTAWWHSDIDGQTVKP